MSEPAWEEFLEQLWKSFNPFSIALSDGRVLEIETQEQLVFRDSDWGFFEFVAKRSADSELVEVVAFTSIVSVRFKRPRVSKE